jgi:hypothetical protein
MYVLVKDLPDSIRSTLRSLGYGRADIEVKVGTSFDAPSAYGAGHRARAYVVELATGRTTGTEGAWGGGNPFTDLPVDQGGYSPLPPGFAALTSGYTGIWRL